MQDKMMNITQSQQAAKAHPYADILDRLRPISVKHPPMDRLTRAAQFAPFAALTGYDGEVQEAARLTDAKLVLEENEKQLLDQTMQVLLQKEAEHPKLRVTYFVPDSKKAGGMYRTVEGEWKKLDSYGRALVLMDGLRISLDDILTISEIK